MNRIRVALRYGAMSVVPAILSTTFIVGVQAQAATRLCDPVQPMPVWVSIGLIALMTAAIVWYIDTNDRRYQRVPF